jgi:hypothetical protein
MPRLRQTEKATDNVKVRKSSRLRLHGLKRYLKADTLSEAVDLAHLRLTGSMEPWRDEK